MGDENKTCYPSDTDTLKHIAVDDEYEHVEKWVAGFNDALYDYAKYLHARREDRYNQIMKRATDIMGFSSLVSALLLFFIRDGKSVILNAFEYSEFLFMAIVISLMVSIILAVLAIKIKRGKFPVDVANIIRMSNQGRFKSAVRMKGYLAIILDSVSTDLKRITRKFSYVLFAAHVFLMIGILSLMTWVVLFAINS